MRAEPAQVGHRVGGLVWEGGLVPLLAHTTSSALSLTLCLFLSVLHTHTHSLTTLCLFLSHTHTTLCLFVTHTHTHTHTLLLLRQLDLSWWNGRSRTQLCLAQSDKPLPVIAQDVLQCDSLLGLG